MAVLPGLLRACGAPAQPAGEEAKRQQRPHRGGEPRAGTGWRRDSEGLCPGTGAPRFRLPRGASGAGVNRGRGGGGRCAAGSAGRGSAWCAEPGGRRHAGGRRGAAVGAAAAALCPDHCAPGARGEPSARPPPSPLLSGAIARTTQRPTLGCRRVPSGAQRKNSPPACRSPGRAATQPLPRSVMGAGGTPAAAKYKWPQGCYSSACKASLKKDEGGGDARGESPPSRVPPRRANHSGRARCGSPRSRVRAPSPCHLRPLRTPSPPSHWAPAGGGQPPPRSLVPAG
jgi:hypothetical protein